MSILEDADDPQRYEFSDIVTPLGYVCFIIGSLKAHLPLTSVPPMITVHLSFKYNIAKSVISVWMTLKMI